MRMNVVHYNVYMHSGSVMGADGGTIPKRCELVKKKKKKEKPDKNVRNATLWRLCRLSQEPLKRPIVACRLGNLYNKEEVLNAILSKKIGESEVAKHIKGLKDIKELRLADNKEFKDSGADKGDIYKDHNVAPFCCPVTGISMNGNHPFTVNWRCGCVISEKAIEKVKSDVCHGCGGPLNKDDLIFLNPPEDILEIYKKMEAERIRRKVDKASIKNVIFVEQEFCLGEVGGFYKMPISGTGSVKPKLTEEKANTSCKIEEIEFTQNKEKEREHKKEAAALTVFSGVIRKAEKRKATDKTTSIQDSNASAAYKSLFTTCEEAKHKPEPHWITHNPLFY
uniref:Replication termination factor 2 n=1 Tax=Setaria digitata TaxID=48799 RepID=A0A915PZS6_9BILA